METFDMSECYSKLDQKELLSVIFRMIDSALTGHPLLAITVSQKSGRWIQNLQEKLPEETTFTSSQLTSDVQFFVSNAYIEWLGYA